MLNFPRSGHIYMYICVHVFMHDCIAEVKNVVCRIKLCTKIVRKHITEFCII